jgi:hypothetical protein
MKWTTGVSILFAVACSSSAELESPFAALGDVDGPIPGIISFYQDSIVIDVPTTATVGQPFDVLVWTRGDGCFSKGETDVTTTGTQTVVEPFDNVLRGVVCNSILLLFEHTASVTLTEPGEHTIVVRGWILPQNTVYEEEFKVLVSS